VAGSSSSEIILKEGETSERSAKRELFFTTGVSASETQRNGDYLNKLFEQHDIAK
jgi:hypothetical protein